MDENKTLWNKTTAELTVKDQLLVATIAPIIVFGGVIAAGTAFEAVITVKDKFKSKFKTPKTETVEEII